MSLMQTNVYILQIEQDDHMIDQDQHHQVMNLKILELNQEIKN